METLRVLTATVIERSIIYFLFARFAVVLTRVNGNVGCISTIRIITNLPSR